MISESFTRNLFMNLFFTLSRNKRKALRRKILALGRVRGRGGLTGVGNSKERDL